MKYVVKIIKCDNPICWYYNHIDKYFDVEDLVESATFTNHYQLLYTESNQLNLKIQSWNRSDYVINKNDCIIEDSKFKIRKLMLKMGYENF